MSRSDQPELDGSEDAREHSSWAFWSSSITRRPAVAAPSGGGIRHRPAASSTPTSSAACARGWSLRARGTGTALHLLPTPQGFAEKSSAGRLDDHLFVIVLVLCRARADCMAALEAAKQQAGRELSLPARRYLADSRYCALECGMTIVAVVDPQSTQPQLIGAPVYRVLR